MLFSIDNGGVGVFRGCEATIKGVDHVVGGDPGWEANTDVATWAVNKIFTVGDSICESTFHFDTLVKIEHGLV